MIADLFTAWSAAFTVWYWGAMCLCLVRLYDVWTELAWRDRFVIAGIAASAAGWGVHQTASTALWMVDVYSVAAVRPETYGYRFLATIGVLSFGGGISFDRCGHRGWIGLVLVGLLAGGVAVLVS